MRQGDTFNTRVNHDKTDQLLCNTKEEHWSNIENNQQAYSIQFDKKP